MSSPINKSKAARLWRHTVVTCRKVKEAKKPKFYHIDEKAMTMMLREVKCFPVCPFLGCKIASEL